MKTISIRQFATIKRVAQNVNPLVVKKNKIAAKIDELNAEYNALTEEIEGHETGVKSLTGGLTSEDLVVKKVEDTGKVGKDGKPVKVTKYEPKAGVVVFNEEASVYEIHVEEPEVEDVAPETVDDTEKAPEIEVKAGEESPFDPTNPFNNGVEAGDKLPFEE
jgi:hypothetical protein|nr:MAG TPA: hypothetical protein [Crassvirales sp.]